MAPVSNGFQVVMADLQQAARTFETESQAFAAIMPEARPVPPDGGSSAIDQSLGAIMETIDLLHLQIAGTIKEHATKLRQAHDTYARTEESLTKLCSQISDPGKIGKQGGK